MSLESVAEEYFSQINPIASRMYLDMKEVKAGYEDLWSTLTEEEQKQILSESIIKPEVSVQYKQIENVNVNTKFAVKRIIDDNYSYRDEHSGPFSFRTPSQRDLTVFEKTKKHPAQKVIPKMKLKKTEEILFTDDIVFTESNESNTNTTNSLPKTGLDFLDNW